jgi:hypothetical protein
MSTRISYASGGNPGSKEITGAYSVGPENNIEFILKAAAGAAVTLPAPYPGADLRFTVGSAFATTNWTVVTNASANIINGSVEVAGAVVVAGTEDTVSFVATAETIGDTVRLSSDGTSWFLSGSAALSGGITATTAS